MACAQGDPPAIPFIVTSLSWNVNGLNRKFWDFLGYLRLNNFPLIIKLQETHSCPEMALFWASKLGSYFCYFSHGTRASCGTALFIHKSLPFTVTQELCDINGRYVILKGFLSGLSITIGSIYAPSDTARNREFFFDQFTLFIWRFQFCFR